jgi:hypothetical protein
VELLAFWICLAQCAYLLDQLLAVLASFGEMVHEGGANEALVAHGGGRAFLADPDTLERT